MARRIEFSAAAEADLDAIAYYGAMEFGLSAARQYVRALEDGLKLLVTFPDAAPAIAATDEGLRLRSVKSHRFV
ncbi:MAG: type II toxin-antitoxin system RelE/ParE family toxin [Caulobacterales bacterium]|uniref:type II toxin-antitoxin system RelE/ParE family toxin n=1 Tax=Glycocaulis sp. TaxID=1969725 RepID=UPI003F9F1D59